MAKFQIEIPDDLIYTASLGGGESKYILVTGYNNSKGNELRIAVEALEAPVPTAEKSPFSNMLSPMVEPFLMEYEKRCAAMEKRVMDAYPPQIEDLSKFIKASDFNTMDIDESNPIKAAIQLLKRYKQDIQILHNYRGQASNFNKKICGSSFSQIAFLESSADTRWDNIFTNAPSEFKSFLEYSKDGDNEIHDALMNRLAPDRNYEIKISIMEVK